MNQVVAIADLLLSLSIFAGVAMIALGAFMIATGGKSPDTGTEGAGVFASLIGLALIVGGVWGLLL